MCVCVSLTDSDASSLTSADIVETEEEESGEDFSTAVASTSFWAALPVPVVSTARCRIGGSFHRKRALKGGVTVELLRALRWMTVWLVGWLVDSSNE